jgi:holo-[acyl-carrier protein] synthase
MVGAMVVGLGIDLVELDRVRHALDRWGERLVDKLMDPAESSALPRGVEDRALAVAGAIGGKEAASKALGTGWSRGVQWRHVVVDLALPEIRLHGRAAEVARRLGAATRGPLWLERRGDLLLAEFRLMGRDPQ